MTEIKIKRITKLDTGRVVNIEVKKNHTMISDNGIITHNCERLSQNAQDSLKNFIEMYSDRIRFVFTTNNIKKVIDPLRSRCEEITYYTNDPEEKKKLMINYSKRLLSICKGELVVIKNELIGKIVEKTFPDFRRAVKLINTYVKTNGNTVGEDILTISLGVDDILFKALKVKDYNTVNKIVPNIESSNFYGDFDDKIEEYIDESNINKARIILGTFNANHSTAIDEDVHLKACLAHMMESIKFK